MKGFTAEEWKKLEDGEFVNEGPDETWTLYLRKDSKGRPKVERLVYTDFDSFTEGLPEDEKSRLAAKYNVPGFKIFMEGCKYMFDFHKPAIRKLIEENKTLQEQLWRSSASKPSGGVAGRHNQAPPMKEPRKLRPKQDYLNAIEEVDRMKNGKLNLTAIGKKLRLKDGTTVKEHLLFLKIPIK